MSRPDKFFFLSVIVFCLICVVHPTLADAQYTPDPANGDQRARTPEQIAKVNLALFAKGDKKAAWELGLAYMQGYGVPLDFARAEQMYRIGAIEPRQKAMVGELYARGMYFPQDLQAAFRWYRDAGRPGDLFELAELYKAAGEADSKAAPRCYPKATPLYLELLAKTGQPEVRRAQMELGNFVIDGIYSAGRDAKARAQNLEWARIIAQELLGQEEYKIAVDYTYSHEDLSADLNMWLRYCKRAAAYNIDLAQHFYVQALTDGRVHDDSGYDYVSWTRLAAQKQYGDNNLVQAFTHGFTAQQSRDADAAFNALVETRNRTGAYYPTDDPLNNITSKALAALPQDDPDVQLRRAFSLEQSAANDAKAYEQALDLYRTVRNRRKMDVRFVLGRNSLDGSYGVPKSQDVALYWLHEAANEGSEPARTLLSTLSARRKK